MRGKRGGVRVLKRAVNGITKRIVISGATGARVAEGAGSSGGASGIPSVTTTAVGSGHRLVWLARGGVGGDG